MNTLFVVGVALVVFEKNVGPVHVDSEQSVHEDSASEKAEPVIVAFAFVSGVALAVDDPAFEIVVLEDAEIVSA